jgi:pimeloyl-ACP methyl ester carboxylesterase
LTLSPNAGAHGEWSESAVQLITTHILVFDAHVGRLLSVNVGGITLSYLEDGVGQSTVFVHGVAEDYRAWNSQIEPFSTNHRVIAYSRRMSVPNENGTGYDDSTVDNNTQDLLGLVEELGASPVTLIGHSYGGVIAVNFAVQNPQLIQALVVVEPGLPLLSATDEKSLTGLVSILVRHPDAALSAGRFIVETLIPVREAYRRGDLDGALNSFLDGIQNEKGALGEFPQFAQTMMEENARTIGELEARPPIFNENDPRSISAPTLLIKGTTDPEFMRATVDLMSEIIPRSEVLEVPSSGHFPHIENPEFFNQKVLGFLDEL